GAGEATDEFGRCVNAIALTATWVASATGGAVVSGDPWQAFGSVSIDTRTLEAGALFFAIRGDRFDGAQFAVAAIEGGAAGVVVPNGWSSSGTTGRSASERSATALAERPVVSEV